MSWFFHKRWENDVKLSSKLLCFIINTGYVKGTKSNEKCQENYEHFILTWDTWLRFDNIESMYDKDNNFGTAQRRLKKQCIKLTMKGK